MPIEVKDAGAGYVYIRTGAGSFTVSNDEAMQISLMIRDMVEKVRLKEAIREAMLR